MIEHQAAAAPSDLTELKDLWSRLKEKKPRHKHAGVNLRYWRSLFNEPCNTACPEDWHPDTASSCLSPPPSHSRTHSDTDVVPLRWRHSRSMVTTVNITANSVKVFPAIRRMTSCCDFYYLIRHTVTSQHWTSTFEVWVCLRSKGGGQVTCFLGGIFITCRLCLYQHLLSSRSWWAKGHINHLIESWSFYCESTWVCHWMIFDKHVQFRSKRMLHFLPSDRRVFPRHEHWTGDAI